MAKFRTKPVEVDALFYTYPASDEMREFCGNAYYSEDGGDATHSPEMGLMIDDECHIANEGDWVVKNEYGMLVVMSENKFKTHYEPTCSVCNDAGIIKDDVSGHIAHCYCEKSLKVQFETLKSAIAYIKQADRFNAYAITHTAKSKTEDLRDILPCTFNNQSEDE